MEFVMFTVSRDLLYRPQCNVQYGYICYSEK